jgi:hypothetical protein
MVGLVAGGALDRIHLFDWRRLERFEVHRKSGVNEFPRIRALDQNPVQYLSHQGLGADVQRRVPSFSLSLIEVHDRAAHYRHASGAKNVRLNSYLAHFTCTFT